MIGLLLLFGGLGALYWFSRGKTPDDFVKGEPPRPLPSTPHAPSPERPAGSAAPIPNLVAPPNAFPSPREVPSVRSIDSAERTLKPLKHARPISTEIAPKALKAPSKVTAGPANDSNFALDAIDLDSNAGTSPHKAAGKKPQRGSDSDRLDQKK